MLHVSLMSFLYGFLRSYYHPAIFYAPDPGRMLITPSGKPAFTANSPNLRDVRGVTCAGFSTTVLPAARHDAIFHANIING